MHIRKATDKMDHVITCRGVLQRAYIEIDPEEETIEATYALNDTAGFCPSMVYDGLIYRYRIPNLLPNPLNELMEEILPLAEKIKEGYSRHPEDGRRGTLSKDAQEADRDIEILIQAKCWDENDLVTSWDDSQEGLESITKDTTDKEIEDLVEAAPYTIKDHLEWRANVLRDSLREQD